MSFNYKSINGISFLVSGDQVSKMGMTKFISFETLTKLYAFYSQIEEKQVFLKKITIYI